MTTLAACLCGLTVILMSGPEYTIYGNYRPLPACVQLETLWGTCWRFPVHANVHLAVIRFINLSSWIWCHLDIILLSSLSQLSLNVLSVKTWSAELFTGIINVRMGNKRADRLKDEWILTKKKKLCRGDWVKGLIYLLYFPLMQWRACVAPSCCL